VIGLSAASRRDRPLRVLTASAIVIGDVEVGAETSIWFHAVVRATSPDPHRRAHQRAGHATIHVLGGRAASRSATT